MGAGSQACQSSEKGFISQASISLQNWTKQQVTLFVCENISFKRKLMHRKKHKEHTLL